MKLAWFRPTRPERPPLLDDLAGVISQVRQRHSVEVIDAASAHDFVWRHARGAFDLAVYELDGTRDHAFIWAYLLNYPGVVTFRAPSIHASRAEALLHRRRAADYAAELAFSEGQRRAVAPWHVGHGSWPMLRVPLRASRMTIVPDLAWALALERDHPGAVVRAVPIGVPAPASSGPPGERPATPDAPLVVACLDDAPAHHLERAVARVREAGSPVTLLTTGDPATRLRQADVVAALGRPAVSGPMTAALLGLAAGKAVLVAETEPTAAWPALDPQNWQPRVNRRRAPVVVSIDPRDEEHSLVLALRRLAGDAPFRRALGEAGHAWWQAHGSSAVAAASWLACLEDALALPQPARPDGWPAHLDDDGTGRARAFLAECGVTTDLF